ncbi:MAG: hypothetical protein ACP5I4_01570 [Oceanipulchritudo sp.]
MKDTLLPRNGVKKCLMVAIGLCGGMFASASLVTESFDGYGAATISLAGLNGGSGWDGAWYNVIGTDMNYVPSNTNLSNPATGYVDINGATANDGQMQGTATGSYNNNRTGRTILGGPVTSGTVWISFITTFDANGRAQVYLDGSNTTPRMGIDVRRLFVRGSGTTVYSSGDLVTTDRNWLIVCRVDLNTNGTTTDTLSVYAIADNNPNALDAVNVADTGINLTRVVTDSGEFIDQIDSVNFVLDAGTFIDQVRISYGQDEYLGFQEILTGVEQTAVEAGPYFEYFDGYGTLTAPLSGFNGGTGWADAWYNVIGTDVNYISGNTNFNNAFSGYVDVNGTTASDGQIQGAVTADFNDNRTGRDFGDGPVTTGTVWFSCVTTFDPEGRVQWYLNGSDTAPRMGLAGRQLFVLGSGIDPVYTLGDNVTTDRTWLLVGRLDLNADGSTDTLTMYAIADDNGNALTPASIDSPAVNLGRNVSVTGNFLDALESVNIVLDDGTVADQLRIGHGFDAATGFNQILTGSTAAPPVAPVGVDISLSGADIVVSFESDSAFNYTLEFSDDGMITWSAVPDQVPAAPVPGNDGTLSITDPGGVPGAGNKVFYRVNVSN